MSDCEKLNQTDEGIFREEVSDEAIEAASVVPQALPTLMHNTYCFACPVDNPQQSYSTKMGAADRGEHRQAAEAIRMHND